LASRSEPGPAPTSTKDWDVGSCSTNRRCWSVGKGWGPAVAHGPYHSTTRTPDLRGKGVQGTAVRRVEVKRGGKWG